MLVDLAVRGKRQREQLHQRKPRVGEDANNKRKHQPGDEERPGGDDPADYIALQAMQKSGQLRIQSVSLNAGLRVGCKLLDETFSRKSATIAHFLSPRKPFSPLARAGNHFSRWGVFAIRRSSTSF